MIHLTSSAADAVRTAVAGAAEPVSGLRIKVKTGGCAGYQYMMGLVRVPEVEDIVVETDGVKVFVDPGSRDLVSGMTIDFVVALEGSGFTFENPNATATCGCGKSFS